MGSTNFTFDFTKTDEWLSHLEREGFVVVSGILTEDDIATGISLFERHLKTQFPRPTSVTRRKSMSETRRKWS